MEAFLLRTRSEGGDGDRRARTRGRPHSPEDLSMMRWTECAEYRRAQGKRTARAKKRLARLTLESLEDRIAPATSLAPPTLLDPTAGIRIDQVAYTIRGAFQQAAKNGAT